MTMLKVANGALILNVEQFKKDNLLDLFKLDEDTDAEKLIKIEILAKKF